MPMLKWAGKEKVVNHHNDVPFRVLERKWGWGKCCQCENVASTNANSQLGNGNIGIDNTSTIATLNKSTVLGIHEGTAYVLLYNGILKDRSVNGGNVLTTRERKNGCTTTM